MDCNYNDCIRGCVKVRIESGCCECNNCTCKEECKCCCPCASTTTEPVEPIQP